MHHADIYAGNDQFVNYYLVATFCFQRLDSFKFKQLRTDLFKFEELFFFLTPYFSSTQKSNLGTFIERERGTYDSFGQGSHHCHLHSHLHHCTVFYGQCSAHSHIETDQGHSGDFLKGQGKKKLYIVRASNIVFCVFFLT